MAEEANGRHHANNQGTPSYIAPSTENTLQQARIPFKTDLNSTIAASFRSFPEIEKLRMQVNVKRMTRAIFQKLSRKMQISVQYSAENAELIARLYRVFKVFSRKREIQPDAAEKCGQTEGIQLTDSEAWLELLRELGVATLIAIRGDLEVSNVLHSLVYKELPEVSYTDVFNPELSFALYLTKHMQWTPCVPEVFERVLNGEMCDRLTREQNPYFSLEPHATHLFAKCGVPGVLLAIEKSLNPEISIKGRTHDPYSLAWLYYCGVLGIE